MKETKNKPWDTGKSLDTEAKWVAWIRGSIRKAWTRYPTQNEYKNSMKKKVVVLDEDGNPKVYKTGKKKGQKVTRFECPCEECNGVFPATYVQVDHVESAGATPDAESLIKWILKIFCGTDNLQLLCKDCHEIKTHMDRYGFATKEEAIKDKARIELFKRPVAELKKALKEMGAKEEDLKNDDTRKEFYKRSMK